VAHNDIYLVVQPVQAPHQSIDREFTNATGDQRGNVRLLEAEQDRSPCLGKLPAFENTADFANELGLEKLFFRIGKPEIGKNITAARGYFFGVAHFVRPFPCDGEGFSFNYATAAAVTPLPPTWTMMLIGLAGFGFAAYRRKSRPALMAA
jgi:hypothetical protein